MVQLKQMRQAKQKQNFTKNHKVCIITMLKEKGLSEGKINTQI